MHTESENTNQENVINLFAKKSAKESSNSEKSDEEKKSESFAEIMKRNAENKERVKQERLKANKGVIRSYRLLKK